MKTLVICRHAKSDWPSDVSDIDRPLKERGIQNADFLGGLLADQGFMPDLIISSPANRALSTARLVAKKLGYSRREIQVEPSVYYEGSGSLLQLVRDLPQKLDTVMIFGHNPTMESVVREILQIGAPVQMPTGAMACVETLSGGWSSLSARHAHLRWMLVPRLDRKAGSED